MSREVSVRFIVADAVNTQPPWRAADNGRLLLGVNTGSGGASLP